MCHSVEMYMPRLTRQAAEYRLGLADLAAARRERAAVGMAVRLWTWLRGLGRRHAMPDPSVKRTVEEVQ